MTSSEVKKLLKDNLITQQQLADYMGLHLSTVTRWINYEMLPGQERRIIAAINKIIKEQEKMR